MTRIDSSAARSAHASPAISELPGATAKAVPSAPVIPDLRLPSRPPQVKVAYADAFNTPKPATLSTQRAIAGGTLLCDFVHENASQLSRAKSSEDVAATWFKAANAQRNGPRDLTMFAHRFSPEAFRNHVTRLVRESIRSENNDAVIDGIVQGMAQVVVNETARKPVREGLVEVLAGRNEDLEAIANGADPKAVRNNERGPGSAPWDASAAREQLKANDRIIHDLGTYSGASAAIALYSLAPDITRVSLETDVINLPGREYPFANTKADTFAQQAVLDELASVAPADDTTRSLIQSAAQSARRAARDLLSPRNVLGN